MSDAYIDEILSEVKVVTTPLLVTVDVISAENTVVSDDVVVMAETIDVEVLAQSNTFEMAADGAFNVVTINYQEAIFGYVDPPETRDSPGIPGQQSFDDDYHYICVALNRWARTPLEKGF